MAGVLGCRPGALERALARCVGLIVVLAVVATGATGGRATAFAQSAPAAPAPAAAETPVAATAPESAAPTPAPASTPASKGVVTGYAYRASSAPAFSSDAPRHRRHLLAHHANEAVATFTGFEMLADGGSRLFVQLSRQVDVAQATQEKPRSPGSGSPKKGKRAHGAASSPVVSSLKFVLKGAEVLNPNNERALVTVHFNTPVVQARLVPSGRDLDLRIELRADVTPQMKVVPAKDNGALLQIDFAPGAYLPSGVGDTGDGAADATGASAPAALPTPSGLK